MSNFLQLHILTSYGPSCLNRDDTGRPKSAVVGGVQRLRISSQCLKRAWRNSDVVQNALANHLGQRTKRIGEEILAHLVAKGTDEKKALAAAREVAAVFGAVQKKGETARIEQLAFVSPEEYQRAVAVAERIVAGEKVDLSKETIFGHQVTAADLAMFGRMLAADPDYNIEAAVQVSHAITTHKVVSEDDYFTALDDLGEASDAEGTGAAHLGVREFGAGLFYCYVCINLDLLRKNLGGNDELAAAAVEALTTAATTVSPSGHQASYASHACASYVLAEKGTQQPRSLVGAFTKPVWGKDQVRDSVAQLNQFRDALDAVYGQRWSEQSIIDISNDTPVGSLKDVATFARAA